MHNPWLEVPQLRLFERVFPTAAKDARQGGGGVGVVQIGEQAAPGRLGVVDRQTGFLNCLHGQLVDRGKGAAKFVGVSHGEAFKIVFATHRSNIDDSSAVLDLRESGGADDVEGKSALA